jgi:hypothetical protein
MPFCEGNQKHYTFGPETRIGVFSRSKRAISAKKKRACFSFVTVAAYDRR